MCHVNYYCAIWNQITAVAPRAVLLRGPLDSAVEQQGNGHSDMDIFAGSDYDQITAVLRGEGFSQVYKPYPYLQRFRLRCPDCLTQYTVDVYKEKGWGNGFVARPEHPLSQDLRLTSLLHAVVDGKGTSYFEAVHGGPPWEQGETFKRMFGSSFAKSLWKRGIKWALTAHLCAKRVIRPKLKVVALTFLRKTAFRLWQLTHKSGMEVALIGVDGTGKSSIADALKQLPVPTTIVYMGPHSYRTRLMKAAVEWGLPQVFSKIFFRYENLLRRLVGWFYCRRGYLVIYDRHPAEQLQPDAQSAKGKIRNVLDRVYAWRVDLTFWLTGNYSVLYERKKEYPAAYLSIIDKRFENILRKYDIPAVKVDVTQLSLPGVTELISRRVLADYAQRSSTDRITGWWRTILV